MNKQELIEKLEERKTIIGNFQGYAVWWEDVKEIFEELLDEPSSGHAEEAPRYVKNILARLRELPLHDREVWLKAIMSEFEQDFSHAKWREGYEQGKFEGEWVDRPKPVVPQFVADWYEDVSDEFYIVLERLVLNYRNNTNMPICKWFFETEDALKILINMHQFGYEVEKDKRYLVKLQGIEKEKCYLNYNFGGVWLFYNQENFYGYRAHHTRKELEDAGFGWVFDCLGIEIEEVE